MTARFNCFCALLSGIHFSNNGIRVLAALCVAIAAMLSCGTAGATTLFWEDFDGYTSFPTEDPQNDPVNPGLPQISEGADELWYGARFENPDNGSIQQDLAVQKFGGSPNNTHVGRAEDDAGLLFNISTASAFATTLDFDWRLFSGGTGDRLRVGYFVGNITGFAADRTKNMIGEWNLWTEILVGDSNSWHHASSPLPAGEASVWVAFWMDDGEGDYIKIDNIHVQAELVPEPTTFVLGGMGAAGIGLVALRRRRARKATARVRPHRA